jgi:predicted AAA+ superfamily ATPase
MPLTEQGYMPRLIDPIIDRHLRLFGAVSVEGPKWSGKTWTSLNHAESVFFVGDHQNDFANRQLARLDLAAALEGEQPHLIDEWQEVPAIWDAVRFAVDRGRQIGAYLLAGSSNPPEMAILHSGAGRIARLPMKPMTLYEMGASLGTVSLKGIFEGKGYPAKASALTLDSLIDVIVRGGWPGNIDTSSDDSSVMPMSYLDALVHSDMSSIGGVSRNHSKFRALLRSLARNNASLVTNRTLAAGTVNESEDAVAGLAQATVTSYLEALRRLYVLEEIPAWSPEARAKIRLRASPKRLLVDPSLAVAALNMDMRSLRGDLKTLGLLFEGLCLRDLSVYGQSNDAMLYHYSDSTNLEIDAVLEMRGGDWAAFEIKLGHAQVDAAAHQLLRMRDKIVSAGNRPPCCLGVIVGVGAICHKREDGVHVLPVDCLAP